jgi:cell fate (sporulation/competence/biofilm development) regulator YmcA (YheA/YmcA/DUF963 family)
MNELIDKVEQLKRSIDDTKEVKELLRLNKKIMQDKDLLNKIKEYQVNPQESLKEEIVGHPLFLKYKEKETNLNVLILMINQELKKLKDKGTCHK